MTTNIVLEMGYAADLHKGALIGTAVVLFVFILIINFLLSMVKGKAVS
jgi:phosphate transport system permease protein